MQFATRQIGDDPARRFPMPVFSADATDLTRLLVVSDLRRSVDWYRDVLGAEIVGEISQRKVGTDR